MIVVLLIFLTTGCTIVNGICPPAAFVSMPFVLEYSIWRGWTQAIIFTPNIEPDCQWAVIRLVKCLSVNGIATSKNSLISPRSVNKLGIAIMSPDLGHNGTTDFITVIRKLHELRMNTASFDWLITVRSDKDFEVVNGIINRTSIRFDQNLVISYSHRYEKKLRGVCDSNFVYKRKNNSKYYFRSVDCDKLNCCKNSDCRDKSDYERSYFRSSERLKNLSKYKSYEAGNSKPLFQSGNIYNMSRRFEMGNVSGIHSLSRQLSYWNFMSTYDRKGGIYVLQYFKARNNSTLYAHLLGMWSKNQSMSLVEAPYPVEVRNLLGEELYVGRCNSSWDETSSPDSDGPSAPALLDDVLYFLTVRLNTTSVTRYYSKLGFRSYEGSWTGLLGALMDHSVDLALEPVTTHTARHDDMDLGCPIAETMCNIYIRQQETSTVRDIFLAPFSARLVACVFAVALIASLTVILISRMATMMHVSERNMGYTEALIWSIGILCQQGASWTPPNAAGSFVLIACLSFALVTYNAYAAFITSVLSVRVASVDDVAAVLQSPNIKIGYIRNGIDQLYLMSTKDTELNAFYIRGYSNAENLVSTAEEGLERAASQDYAFFAGQRVARSTLRSFSQARGRCAVRELQVPSTKAYLAFPLPQHSPYARPILYSLLHLRSGGAMARLKAALVPDMPQCSSPTGFASARATDVRSALILFAVGFLAALLVGLGEYIWKNRREQRKILRKYYSRLISFLH